MAHEKLRYTLNQIDNAGTCIRELRTEGPELSAAYDVLFNWRSAHSFPLNSLHMTLRGRAKKIDPKAITAQRLKRYDSIFRKLFRFEKMQLSQMQDVGGCRAIMSGIRQLNAIVALYEDRPLRHDIRPIRNYVKQPKEDGYRGVHLMYRFVGSASSIHWNRLRVEVQLRTKMQHAWATAVETVDVFREGELKFGGGSSKWRRFFQLSSSAMANMEGCDGVPGTPSSRAELKAEISDLEAELGVLSNLSSWSMVTRHITGAKSGKDHWYVIEIDPVANTAHINSFPLEEMAKANEYYNKTEIKNKYSRRQSVLVSINSIDNLQKAYPNYFADTQLFSNSLRLFLSK